MLACSAFFIGRTPCMYYIHHFVFIFHLFFENTFSMDSATWNKAHFGFDSMLMYHLLTYLWPFYSPLHSLFLFRLFFFFRFAFQIFMFSNVSSFNNGDLSRSFCMQVKWWMFAVILVSIRFEYEKRKSEHCTLNIACI